MPSFDLIVKGGKLVSSRGVRDADLFLSDGRIAALRKKRPSDRASQTIDAKGMLVLPGLIDSHVHFRDPGLTHKEDFETGSRGAAAGGVTTVFDMPTTIPIVTNSAIFREKLQIVGEKSVVDFGLYGAAGSSNVQEIPGLCREGAIALKTYTVAPPAERVKEYEGSFVTNAGELAEVMRAVARTGLLHCLHAEDNSTIDLLSKKLALAGRRDALAHYDSRPNFTEEIAVSYSTSIAEALSAKVHILHTSTREALKIIKAARGRGTKVTCETCPHYMIFTKEALKRFGPYAKFNPPPRLAEDVEAMWEGIKDGTIDMVVSDHAPHAKAEKDRGKTNIWLAPPGTPGVETRLPFLLTYSRAKGLEINDIVRLTSTSISKIFGVSSRKGDLKEGLDGDLAIVNPKVEWKLKSQELQSKARETTIFESMLFKGKVVQTLVRGKVAYEEGVGFGRSGTGMFLPGTGLRGS